MHGDIRRDLARYNRKGRPFFVALLVAAFSHPSFLGLLHYRCSRFLYLRSKNPLARLTFIVLRLVFPLVRVYSGVEVHPRCRIGGGAYFGHFGPIVIHPDCCIGDQVTIMQGVTIGETRKGVPSFGDRVSVGVSASVLGKVDVGDNAVIAAGAVVVRDVVANSVVGGVPARVIGGRSPEDYDEVVA